LPVYQPVDAKTMTASEPMPHPKRSGYRSIFSRWIVVENGVIQTSLKDITILIGFGITISLILMLVVSCSNHQVECTLSDFPMVSYVIALNSMYDRIFILLVTTLMYGVQQANIRAFYKKLYGIIPDSNNNWLLFYGIFSIFSLPAIGLFDCHNWNKIHGTSAVIFFAFFGLYSYKLANYMSSNKDKFPTSEQASIASMKKASNTLFIILGSLGISIAIFGSKVPTPFLEWACVLYYVNFFAIASSTNEYYDSVHEYSDELVKVKKQSN